jgi:hypothetical protein
MRVAWSLAVVPLDDADGDPRVFEASEQVWSYQATHSQSRLLVHSNAPLTPEVRLRLCQRIEAGWPVAHAAASMGISRDRAYV